MNRRTLSAAVGVLLCATSLSAQSLPQQNQEILNELKAIRQLLEKLAGPLGPGAPAPTPVGAVASDRVTLANVTSNVIGSVIGRSDAPLTMVEFTDLQCPFCRQFAVTTFPQIKKDYIDTGTLRYVSRDFPLESLHPLAIPAARASWCAADQGKFWEMRHTILVNNALLTAGSFATFARDLKMDISAFTSCDAKSIAGFQADLQRDLSDAASVGVTGTPTFVIGRTAANGLDGIRIVGAQAFAAFDATFKELLRNTAAP